MAEKAGAGLEKARFIEIWVEVGATVPTQQYANLRPLAGAKLAIDENATKEDIQKLFKSAWSMIADQISARMDDIKGNA